MDGVFYAVGAEGSWSRSTESCKGVFEEKTWCSSEPAGKEASGAEAEESPLLEAVSRERLVKAQQTEKKKLVL
jgi:hypothetical protein